MHYSVSELSQIVLGETYFSSSTSIVEEIVIDTRSFFHANKSIFIALKGAKRNGHNFVDVAYKKGIRSFLVEFIPTTTFANANFIVVTNTLVALQEIAKYHRKKYSLTVLGITGSHGKTVVKEWLSQLLSHKKNIVKSPKSYNSQIGVPLSLLGIERTHEFGLFEAGISKPNEMVVLESIIQPTVGVLTNISDAHIQNFKDNESLIDEKIKFFINCKVIVTNTKSSLILNKLKEINSAARIISWGIKENDVVKVTQTKVENNQTSIEFKYLNSCYSIRIPFSDNASIENACSVFASLIALDLDPLSFLDDFSNLSPVEMRLEMTEGINNCLIINDCYHSDLHSIKVALEALNQQKKLKKTVILSSLSKIEAASETSYLLITKWINDSEINKVILIGEDLIAYKHFFNSLYKYYQTTEEFLNELPKEHFSNEAILIKGSFSFKFNRIAAELTLKKHDTAMEINLHALINNLNTFKSLLKPETKIMCMVKAFSYGTGGYEVAQALEFNGVDYLGVAYADEGVRLRESGISLPIMVLNPEQSSYNTIIKHNLEPEIYSFRVLEKFIQALEKNNTSFAYPVHIKLDTGMNRLGFKKSEISSLKTKLKEYNKLVSVCSIFSHLAESENLIDSSFTLNQLTAFDAAYSVLTNGLEQKPFRHVLNSAGILNHSQFQYEMIRLGIGMYGYIPNDKIKLENVATFKTVISQIKVLEKGESVSYNRNFIAKEKTIIAVLPVGYADGIHRVAGNEKGYVSINNKKSIILGTVCMDSLMVDITTIDCEEGDAACIFGVNPSLKEVADFCDTIPYEILTSISQRVKRIYYKE